MIIGVKPRLANATFLYRFNGILIYKCDEASKLTFEKKLALDGPVWDHEFLLGQHLIVAQAVQGNHLVTTDLNSLTAVHSQDAFFDGKQAFFVKL